MSNGLSLGRRHFLVASSATATGFLLGVLSETDAFAASPSAASPSGGELSAWILIGPDDTTTIRVTTPEIGNGVMTQFAMTVTEELGCDWSRVRTEYAPTSRDLRENWIFSGASNSLAYFSSRSTMPETLQKLLQAGASARERLKAAAAARWKVAPPSITAEAGLLRHAATGRSLRFGEVAAEAAVIRLDFEPAIKPSSEWNFLGKASPAKLTIPSIVNGTAVYGMDVQVEGMVYAALMQPPVFGGRVKSYDYEAIRKMPGVRAVVVIDPTEKPGPLAVKPPFDMASSAPQSAVAVIADHYWQARTALEALPVEWEDGEGRRWSSLDMIREAALSATGNPADKVDWSIGDPDRALASGGRQVEAAYFVPYANHALMEPLNGTALVTADRVDVWHPAQCSKQAFLIAAEETGLPPDRVFFHQTHVGGSFGLRAFGFDSRMVVAVARKYPGRPVHVIWSREETMRQGRNRPMAAARLSATLGADGLPVGLVARVAGRGLSLAGLADCAYVNGPIPNARVDTRAVPVHLPTGPFRGPGYNTFSFITETFIDELAHAAGADPVDYRLRLLKNWPDEGWARCLKVAAAKGEWGKALPKGMGRGVAICNWQMKGKPQNGTTICAVALVEVSRRGAVRVHQVDIAFDTGKVANPDAVRAQLEGATIMGMSVALNEEVSISNGRIVEGNFDEYPVLRMGDTPPRINIHFDALTGHERLSQIGEVGIGPIAPAIGNAIFNATGHRVRSTPFAKHDLRWS